MLCSNCGKNEANVHYTHVVNGNKTEYNLCDECAKKLGIDDIDFSMPISFSNFLSDFFEDDSLLPSMAGLESGKCPKCGLTYDEFAKKGKFGCGECYNTFASRIESVLKNLHGSAKHRGRAPKGLIEGQSTKELKNNNIVQSKRGKIRRCSKDSWWNKKDSRRKEIGGNKMSNWYLQTGKESDIVISSRARLARNLAEFNFKNSFVKDESKSVMEKMEEIAPSLGYGLKFCKMDNIDEVTKISLMEKHLISPEFAMKGEANQAILINDDENICIMINEEDHLRIQVFSAGLEIENLLGLITEIDEKLSTLVGYAYNKEFGYLTACPTNVGTGLRISIMVHLPALAITGNISKVLRAVNSFGMNIRGIYGEGSDSKGNIFQIFNNQSLGLTEKEIMKNVKAVTDKIIEQERLARKNLEKKPIDLEDRVYRAYGVLVNSRKLTSDECRALLSDVKLGTDLGIIKELDDAKVKKIELYTQVGNLQKYAGEELGAFDRDVKRCELIKEILK